MSKVQYDSPISGENLEDVAITGEGIIDGGGIVGLPESCATNIVLENIKTTVTKNFSITNARGVQLKNVVVTVLNGSLSN